MKKEKFEALKNKLEKDVKRKLGNDAHVSREIIAKADGEREKLKVEWPGKNFGRLIDLDMFAENVSEEVIRRVIVGDSFEDAYEEYIDNFIEELREEVPAEQIVNIGEWIHDWEKVKDMLFLRVANYEKAKEAMKEVPYRRIFDLVLFACIEIRDGEGSWCITVNNSMLDEWGKSNKDILDLAAENDKDEMEIQNLEDELSGLGLLSESEKYPEDAPKLFIISNKSRSHGAAKLFYPGTMEKVHEMIGANYFVIPSSIHEMLICPDTGYENPENIREIIKEVNSECLNEADKLSDNLYYYDGYENELRIII